MRDILFKAKRLDNGEWAEGYLLRDDVTGQYFIHASGNSVNESDKVNEEGCLHFVAFEIDKDTICQYTGLTDKNGNKILENDVVVIPTEDGYFTIKWSDTEARWEMENEEDGLIVDFDNYWSYQVEVLGNVFDNPELIGGEANG